MINNAKIARDELVLQTRSVRDRNLVALIGHDNARARESHAFAEPDVARDGQVVELCDIWDGFEALFKVLRGSAGFPTHAQSEAGEIYSPQPS